ncbi:hypothetical protein E2562_019729 [Oryza meyeriana var. granulata]|uniref:Serine-threonine/tyrosine-protein kinase catalytic domain-containing protein n=1 Tax=Oryza meyeriana var. granulata TaxID=110450 RepID=A0A6G1C8C9_9ORYZ|nr:hypothetical protein E2562_019729 [Oryza meyeriana var. granulata]
MLEVLTGKKTIFNRQEEGEHSGIPTSLVAFPLPIIEAGELWKVVDRRPAREPTARQLEAVNLVARAAARCVRLQGKERPAISEVVAILKTALELLSDE